MPLRKANPCFSGTDRARPDDERRAGCIDRRKSDELRIAEIWDIDDAVENRRSGRAAEFKAGRQGNNRIKCGRGIWFSNAQYLQLLRWGEPFAVGPPRDNGRD